MPSRVLWSYGVTTVPSRVSTTLPTTLASLAKAGFDKPRLFIDGAEKSSEYDQFGLETTYRYPTIRTFGNWVLALWELYIRQPESNRFAVFQDDFVCSLNLRSYLELWYPDKGYQNLYTFASNQAIATTQKINGWYESNQLGRGAVALIFSRGAVEELLSELDFVKRPQDPHRGWRAIDGGIVDALRKKGFKEWVHNPSLTQHIGDKSTMQNKPHQKAESFRGEDFDLMTLPDPGESLPTNYGMSLQFWENELAALRRAIAEDEVRFKKAGTMGERNRLRSAIANYQAKIAHLEGNRPRA